MCVCVCVCVVTVVGKGLCDPNSNLFKRNL